MRYVDGFAISGDTHTQTMEDIMKNRRLAGTGLVVGMAFVVATAAYALAADTSKQPSELDAVMMQVQKYGTPGESHKRLEPFVEALEENPAVLLLVVVHSRHREPQRQEAFGAEARLGLEKGGEAPDGEPGRHEQDHRERHLAHDEDVSEPGVTSRRASASAFR